MKVIDLLKEKQTLSFEFFPPKTPEQEARLFKTLEELKGLNPDYAAVTYGALGTTREKSVFWVKQLKSRFALEPVAHLTCVAADENAIKKELDELKAGSIENVLALRGDLPLGERSLPSNFQHASELVAFIKEHYPDLCIGVAGYPEGHPESTNLKEDIKFLKAKVEAGADYIVTQLFFDNNFYVDFVERCSSAGITVPVIPGIMLITSCHSIKKMTSVCGASIPDKLVQKLEKYKDDPKSIVEVGIDQAVMQCSQLKAQKTAGLHFFVMNQAYPVAAVLKQIA